MDFDDLDKLHGELNRKLASWEKKKLSELTKSLRMAEAEIKAMLITAEGWNKTRLELLLREVDQVIDRLKRQAEAWVTGRSDVPPTSPLASLAQYPVATGGAAAMATIGIQGTFTAIHLPVLSYIQDYQLGLIRRITQIVRDQIKEELKLGYIMGDSIPNIAKRLRNTKLDKGVWPSLEKRSVVVARTEILRASNQGAKYIYETHGVKRVIWLTADDERVCPICGPLHKRMFPIDQIPFGAPPAHPQCRCFIAPDIVTTPEEGSQGDKTAKLNVKWWKEKEKGGAA